MKYIRVKKVLTRYEKNDFIELSHKLYDGCPYYIPDLDTDIRALFKTDKSMDDIEIQPFIAYDSYGKAVGRIVGIINHKVNRKCNNKNVRFGYIEFIDDLSVSDALLKAVEKWGKERGMNHIQGPMGICDFDKEGMLIEDFDQMSSMITIYNPPYYPKHLEKLGYEKEVDWIQVKIDIPKEVPARYARVAHYSKEMFELHVKKITKKEVFNRYGKEIFELLNTAYEPIFGFSKLSNEQIHTFIKKYIPLMDTELIPIVENEKGEVVGVAITMGSLSNTIRKCKGKLFPTGWFHLLRSIMWKHEEKVEMMLIAVRPDYQGLGVNALFFDDLIPIYNRLGYTWAETGPQLESNIKELNQWKPLKPQYVKRRRCYRKEI